MSTDTRNEAPGGFDLRKKLRDLDKEMEILLELRGQLVAQQIVEEFKRTQSGNPKLDEIEDQCFNGVRILGELRRPGSPLRIAYEQYLEENHLYSGILDDVYTHECQKAQKARLEKIAGIVHPPRPPIKFVAGPVPIAFRKSP